MERAAIICAWVIAAVCLAVVVGRFIIAPIALHAIVWLADVFFPYP